MKYKQVKFLNKYNTIQIVKMYSEKSVCKTVRYINYVINCSKMNENEIESVKKHCENNNLRFIKSKINNSNNLFYIRFSV